MHTQNSDCCRFRLKKSCYCFEAGSAGDAIITYLRAADWRSRDAGALPSPSIEDQIRSYSHSVAFVKYRYVLHIDGFFQLRMAGILVYWHRRGPGTGIEGSCHM